MEEATRSAIKTGKLKLQSDIAQLCHLQKDNGPLFCCLSCFGLSPSSEKHCTLSHFTSFDVRPIIIIAKSLWFRKYSATSKFWFSDIIHI
jgi:hypothetical protein